MAVKEKSKKKRLEEAASRLEEYQKKIDPFTDERKVIHMSTKGKWRISSATGEVNSANKDREGYQ